MTPEAQLRADIETLSLRVQKLEDLLAGLRAIKAIVQYLLREAP